MSRSRNRVRFRLRESDATRPTRPLLGDTNDQDASNQDTGDHDKRGHNEISV